MSFTAFLVTSYFHTWLIKNLMLQLKIISLGVFTLQSGSVSMICLYQRSTPARSGPRISALEIISTVMDYQAWRAQWGRANKAPSVIHRSQCSHTSSTKHEKDPELSASHSRAVKYIWAGPLTNGWAPATAEVIKVLHLPLVFEGYLRYAQASRRGRAGLDGGLQHHPGWVNDRNELRSQTC